ncbi:MAG TPA: GxxExxY protein [Gemmatimonadaceae bacterium]|nr:GxxExxY protein [Gemmatimonadaceae bacterium]
MTIEDPITAEIIAAAIAVHRELGVEVKAMPRLNPMTDAQVLTYLRFLGLSRGLVLNFDVPLLRDGLRRYVM